MGATFTIFAAATLNFLIFRATPGNAASLTHVPSASPALKAALTRQFGLNRSPMSQYTAYLTQLIHGNLGVSFATQQPVSGTLTTAIRNTLIFAVPGLLLAVALAVSTGLLAAWRHGSFVDHLCGGSALVLYALPAQWLAIMILFLGQGYFPAGGMTNVFRTSTGEWSYITDVANHAVLPTIAYALTAYGAFMIVMRSSLLRSVSEDYILTARTKGLTNWQIVRRHALPTALLPVATLFALTLGSLVAGVLLIESAFSWPGVGLVVYDAVRNRDYPMLQGAFLVFTVTVVLANLAVDLLYRRLDPRVRVGRHA